MAVLDPLIRLHPADSVAVCRRSLAAGEEVTLAGESIAVLDPIPQGHKIALRVHRQGEAVVKYGRQIGEAKEEIAAGRHIHVHNLRTIRGSVWKKR